MVLTGPPLERPVRLSELLHCGLQSNPDASALASPNEAWTCRDLDEASSRLAAKLLELGLRPGDRAATLIPNRTALRERCIHGVLTFRDRAVDGRGGRGRPDL